MSYLSRFRVLTKLLAVIAILSVVATGITVLGVTSLKSLSDATERMEHASANATLAQALAANLNAMNRGEFRIVVDPREQNRVAVRNAIEAERKTFNERLQRLKKNGGEVTMAHMGAIESGWSRYLKELDDTYVIASGIKDVQINADLAELRRSADESRQAAEALRTELRNMADELDRKVTQVSDGAAAEYTATSRLMIGAATLGILFGLGFGFLIGQYGIAKPIRGLVAILQKLAGGDLAVEVSGTERHDEVGEVARAALIFKENGLAKIRLEREQKEAEQRAAEEKQIAAEREAARQKAAEEKAAAERRDAMLGLAAGFERAVGDIIDTVSSASTELEAAANTLTRSADGAQQRSTTVASASQQASANVQSVAGATDELSASVQEINRQVAESSRIAVEAVGQAKKTDARIADLSQAASRIGEVVKLITAIAEQTNLLALNATIEAARAGEAGKGFAVVAQEVKALASQTARATDEIGTQISGMQVATAESVAAIKEIGGTIGHIAEIAASISAAVEQQGAATQEIARNVQQAARGTSEVATNIVEVSRGAVETGAASGQVLSSAQSLARESTVLKGEVAKFLATVRAA
jgi:methyl-accepting chemotaxis protein